MALKDKTIVLEMDPSMFENTDMTPDDLKEMAAQKYATAAIASGFSSMMSQVKDKKSLDKLADGFSSLSHEEILQFFKDLKVYTGELKNQLLLKFLESEMDIMKKAKYDPVKTWIGESRAVFWDEANSKKCRECLSNDLPSLRVQMDWDFREKLVKKYIKKRKFVPSDILFKSQCPVYDMELFVTKRIPDVELDTYKDVTYETRVILYDNYKEIAESLASDGEVAHFGFVDVRIPGIQDSGMLFAFHAMRGFEPVIATTMSAMYGFLGQEDFLHDLTTYPREQDILELVTEHLKTWYAVNRHLADTEGLLESGRMVKDRRKRVTGNKVSNLSRKIRILDLA